MTDNQEPVDLVTVTFQNLRATAKRRNGKVPNLAKAQKVVPTRSLGKGDGPTPVVPGLDLTHETRKPRSFRGRPTGADGRALPRSYEVSGFASLVNKEIEQRDWTESIAHGWVMGNWEELVGAKIAQHTEVTMIKDGEVFVACDQTAWATNLKYMQSTVLAKIAEKIGPGVVTKLHVFPPKTKNWRYGPLHVKGRGPRDTYG